MNEEKIIGQETEQRVLVIDDGKIEIPIENHLHMQIGVLRFSPTDMNIINRYNEVSRKLDDVLKPLSEANITSGGEGEDEKSIQILNKVGEEIIDLLDYIIDGDSREAFFKKMHIFSIVKGHFYCENVFRVIGSFISKEFETEVNNISVRVNEHTHGYKTGKHAKGRT